MMERKGALIALISLAVALLLVQELLLRDFTIDDAYIAYRYARHLAAGGGLAWNVGRDPVEGYSDFLWIVLLALLSRAGAEVPACAKAAGALLAFGNLGLAYLNARLLCRSRAAALLPVLLLALLPAYAAWAVSGMETQLFLFFFLLSLLLFAREERGMSRMPLSACALLLLALTRVEGVAVFAAMAIVRLFAAGRTGRGYLTWLLLFAAPYGAYTAWRVAYFGYLIPNAAYDKMRPGLDLYALVDFACLCLPYLPFALCAFLLRDTRKEAVPAGAAALAVAAVAFNTDPVMGFYYRYLLPVIAVLFILSSAGAEWLFRNVRRLGPLPWIAAGAVLLALIAYPPLFMNLPWMLSATSRMRGETETTIALGRLLGEVLPAGSSIAIANCGTVPYYSRLETLDLWGLNDERIAREGFDASYVIGEKPTVIILTGDARASFRPKGPKDGMIHRNSAFRGEYALLGTVALNRYAAYWLYVRKNAGLQRAGRRQLNELRQMMGVPDVSEAVLN